MPGHFILPREKPGAKDQRPPAGRPFRDIPAPGATLGHVRFWRKADLTGFGSRQPHLHRAVDALGAAVTAPSMASGCISLLGQL